MRVRSSQGFAFLLLLSAAQMVRAQDSIVKIGTERKVGVELARDAEEKRLLKRQLSVSNPVLLQVDSSGQYTLLSAIVEQEKMQLYDPQAGKGLQTYGLVSQGFRRIGDNKSVWGKAYYNKSVRKHVVWNETSDLERVYPYVIADSVGGDMQEETYYLEGGFNHRLGRQVLGISAAYRAANPYRSQDPRPNNVVSDLTIRVGTSRNIAQYITGFSYDFGHYTQSGTVRIANPNIGPSFFHLIGMGMDQKMLWGRYTDTYFKGTEHRFALQLQPKKTQGWYADIEIQKQFIDKSVTALRPFLVGYADTWFGQGKVGYRLERDTYAWEPLVSCKRYDRKGTSFMFNNTGSGSYTKVGEVQDFDHHYQEVILYLGYNRVINNRIDVKVKPLFSYRSEENRYREEDRMWTVDKATWGMDVALWRTADGGCGWEAGLGWAKVGLVNDSYTMNYFAESNGLNELILQKFVLQSTPSNKFNGYFRYRIPVIAHTTAVIGLSANLQNYQNNKRNNHIAASFGLAF